MSLGWRVCGSRVESGVMRHQRLASGVKEEAVESVRRDSFF